MSDRNIAVVVLDALRKDAFDEHFDWLPVHRLDIQRGATYTGGEDVVVHLIEADLEHLGYL